MKHIDAIVFQHESDKWKRQTLTSLVRYTSIIAIVSSLIDLLTQDKIPQLPIIFGLSISFIFFIISFTLFYFRNLDRFISTSIIIGHLLVIIRIFVGGGFYSHYSFWLGIPLMYSVFFTNKKNILINAVISIVGMSCLVVGHYFCKNEYEIYKTSQSLLDQSLTMILASISYGLFSWVYVERKREQDKQLGMAIKEMYDNSKIATFARISNNIVHSFNNKLAVASGNVQILQRQLESKELENVDVKSRLENIQNSVKELSLLVDSMDSFSRDFFDQNLFEEIKINDLILLIKEKLIIKDNIEFVSDNKNFKFWCRPNEIVDVFSCVINACVNNYTSGKVLINLEENILKIVLVFDYTMYEELSFFDYLKLKIKDFFMKKIDIHHLLSNLASSHNAYFDHLSDEKNPMYKIEFKLDKTKFY